MAVCWCLAISWAPIVSAQDPLDSMSDQELIDLYIDTYQQSLRDSVIDNTNLVSRGSTLFQLGYSYTTDSDGTGLRYSTHTVPELLIRRRLTERFEARLGWSGVTFERLHDKTTGVTERDSLTLNPSLGLRMRLWSQSGLMPQTSLTVSTPVEMNGDISFLSRLNPQVSAGYSWLCDDNWLISGSTSAVWTRDLDQAGNVDRFLDLQQSVSIDWLINDQASVYLQWTTLVPEGARLNEIGHSIGPGISLPLWAKTQLDTSAMFGLDDDSPDLGVQVFLSWRR